MSEKHFGGRSFITAPSWQGCLIVFLVFLGYFPALCGGFVWDDDLYVTANQTLRSISGLWQIWINPHATPQYYPLVHTSFWLEYQIWGLNPTGYHIVNAFLHSMAALLLWRVLLRLQLSGAWLVAAIFAVHPVMVESVAWVTERKNVLSAVFYLSSALAYLRWIDPSASRPSRIAHHWWYNIALLLFICALLSKTTACSLPAALLLVIYWQHGRILAGDVWPLLRFFGAGVALGLATAWLERTRVGASGLEWDINFWERCLIAGRALWFYVGKLVWPTDLTFIYPRWQIDAGVWWQWMFPLAAIIVVATLWVLRRRLGRGPLVAVLFFAGTLFPALGFFNLYPMRYSFVADHFQYLASVGLMTLAIAGVMRASESLRKPVVAYGFGAIVLPVLTLLTWRQAGMFTDLETLWRTTLARNPECPLAHNNLGTMLFFQGNIKDAVEHYQKAIQTKPDYYEALYNLGLTLANESRFDEAIENYRKAIRFYPTFPDALNSLGVALVNTGKTDEAIRQYHEAIRLKPDFVAARHNLGIALLNKGEIDEAIGQFEQITRLMPNAIDAQTSLAGALELKRKVDLAESNPDDLNNLAWELATSPDTGVRNGTLAVKLAERACELTHYQVTIMIGTLAAAYAEAGRFDEAILTAQKACVLASELKQTDLLIINQELVVLYQARQTYREPPAKSDGSVSQTR